jgi:hypothetical protein
MKEVIEVDIAALSTVLAQGRVMQQVGVAIASKVMNVSEQQGADFIQLMESSMAMEQSVAPHLGATIDIKL